MENRKTGSGEASKAACLRQLRRRVKHRVRILICARVWTASAQNSDAARKYLRLGSGRAGLKMRIITEDNVIQGPVAKTTYET